jgi:hypothetical protein
VGFVDPEGTQLGLHEGEQPGPVVPVELLQGLDLLLQPLPLRGEVADLLVVPLPGQALEPVRLRPRLLDDLGRLGPRVGDDLLPALSGGLRVRLDLLDRLLRLRSRVGEHLVGLPPHGLGLGLRLPDDPLGHPARIGQDLVGLAVRGGDVLLRRPLSEGQHLQGLLDVAARLRVERARRSGWRGLHAGQRGHPGVVRLRLAVLPLGAGLHPAIGQGRTSLRAVGRRKVPNRVRLFDAGGPP